MTNKLKQPIPHLYKAFCDPFTHEDLKLQTAIGLTNSSGTLYKFIDSMPRIIDFIEPSSLASLDNFNLEMYNSKNSTQIYRNFLNWLFETFGENEESFRRNIFKHLKLSSGMKVLITGCGLGEDIPLIINIIGAEGELHAQD